MVLNRKKALAEPAPPEFVMWNSDPPNERAGWTRHWFGSELNPKATFIARGIGLSEPMFNANVLRPVGTGDWLLMYFHRASRLSSGIRSELQPAKTMMVWAPGTSQFYSWGRKANVEPHSWIHCEGSWVQHQVHDNQIPVGTPFVVKDEELIIDPLTELCREMTHGSGPDPVIMHNVFQNWMRSVARYLGTSSAPAAIPENMLLARRYLDQKFTQKIVLDELASEVFLSRSHLCNQFRRYFGITIGNYVLRRRMSVAQRLLFDVNLRPGEIAVAVGFPDIYQFSKQFKKTFGMSPARYRRQQFVGETDG